MIKLPPLVLFNDYLSYEDYIEAVYYFFREDFFNSKVFYLDKQVVCNLNPKERGKEVSFWHIITRDLENGERLLDTKRSERIRWPKPIIEGFKDSSIKVWQEVRKNKKNKNQARVHFCFGDWEYLVVLNKRPGCWILCTAFPIHNNEKSEIRYKRKLQERYEECIKKQTPSF